MEEWTAEERDYWLTIEDSEFDDDEIPDAMLESMWQERQNYEAGLKQEEIE